MADDKRRAAGFAMFGSAALIGLAAVLVLTGVICLDGQSSRTIGMLVGGVAVFDAGLGVYFVLSS